MYKGVKNMLNFIEMIYMKDVDFMRYLLSDASEQERQIFFREFPECQKEFESYLVFIENDKN